MSLCCCLLVKNEAKRLSQLLSELVDAFDEIVVVDNGSTDNSMEIAKKFNCKCIKSELELDLARNVFFEVSESEWLFVLDTDEYILKNDVIRLKKMLSNTPNNVYALTMPRYDYLGAGQWAWSPITRIIRNDDKVRYNNLKIHATVVPSILKFGGEINSINIPIHHFDVFKGNKLLEKRNRYIDLIKDAIAENSNQTTLYSLLALEYSVIGEYGTAEELFHKHIHKTNGENAFAFLLLAEHYYYIGKYEQAMDTIEVVMSLCENELNRKKYLDQAMVIKANLCIKANDRMTALSLLKDSLSLENSGPQKYINVASLMEDEDPEEAIKYLLKCKDINPFVTNGIIYSSSTNYSIYNQQNSFVCSASNFYNQIISCYRKLGYSKEEKFWISEYRDAK